jgi:hypothetical protein
MMRKPVITILMMLCLSWLFPSLCQAGGVTAGADPFAPVIFSTANSPLEQAKITAGTKTSAAPGGINATLPLKTSNIPDAAGRIDQAAGVLAAAAGVIVIPLAAFVILTSVLALLLGSLSGWDGAKRFGLNGLFTACIGLLVYYSYPLISRLIGALIGRLA